MEVRREEWFLPGLRSFLGGDTYLAHSSQEYLHGGLHCIFFFGGGGGGESKVLTMVRSVYHGSSYSTRMILLRSLAAEYLDGTSSSCSSTVIFE